MVTSCGLSKPNTRSKFRSSSTHAPPQPAKTIRTGKRKNGDIFLVLKMFCVSLLLRLPNQYTSDEHQRSAQANLHGRREPRSIHVAFADPGDDAELHDHDRARGPEREAKIFH